MTRMTLLFIEYKYIPKIKRKEKQIMDHHKQKEVTEKKDARPADDYTTSNGENAWDNLSENTVMDASALGFKKIERQTIQEVIYESLKDAIMKGQIRPGVTLTVVTLAKEYGTSPMPVREALARLVEADVLVATPNKSVSMPVLRAAELREMARIRMNIEGMAGNWAAENITAEEIEQIEIDYDRMCGRIQTQDKAEVTKVHQKVHFAIYRATRSKYLVSIIERLWMRNGPYFSMLSWDAFRVGECRHMEMIDGLKNGDGSMVQKAIQSDISDALDSLLKGEYRHLF